MSDNIAFGDKEEFSRITAQFGKSLGTIRKEMDLTQHDLADRSGVSLRMISDLERGIRQPSLVTIFKLAKGLDMPPLKLIERLLKDLEE